MIWIKRLFTPCHNWCMSRIHEVSWSYALRWNYTPRLIFLIAGLTVRVSSLSWVVLLLHSLLQRLFCNCKGLFGDRVHQIRLYHITLPFSDCSTQVRVELAVPHCSAMFVGFSTLECVQHLVLWLRILAWQLIWHWAILMLHEKSIGWLQSTWHSVRLDTEPQVNLRLSKGCFILPFPKCVLGLEFAWKARLNWEFNHTWAIKLQVGCTVIFLWWTPLGVMWLSFLPI